MINWRHYRQQYLEFLFLTINGQNFTLKSKVLFPYSLERAEVLINKKFNNLIYDYTKIKLSNYPIINDSYKTPLLDVICILISIRKQIYTEKKLKIIRSETVVIHRLSDINVIKNKHVFQLNKFFNRKLEKYIYSSFVQGSVATEDYTRFSDFDTFIILKKKAIHDKDDFLRFMIENIKSSKYLYRFDPYQHHRNWICHQEDLQCYDQSILPIEVIKYGRVILGKQTIQYDLICSNDSILYHAAIGLNSLRHKIESGTYLKNMWHFKDFISTLLLMPVVLLELKGIYVYKRESFELAKKEFFFSDEEWKAIDIATQVRSTWSTKLNLRHQLGRLLLLNLHNNPLVYQDFAKKYGETIQEDILNMLMNVNFISHVMQFIDKSAIIIENNK